MTSPMNSPSETLRDDLKKLKLYFDSPHYKAPLELDDDAIDEILALVLNKLPERKDSNIKPGQAVTLLSDELSHYFAPYFAMEAEGWNAAIDSVRNLLEGR